MNMLRRPSQLAACRFVWFHAGAQSIGTSRYTVIELFTSQSCYFLPLARKAYSRELSQEDDIVRALEYLPVDLPGPDQTMAGHGRWVDEFSSPEILTQRRAATSPHPNTRSPFYTRCW